MRLKVRRSTRAAVVVFIASAALTACEVNLNTEGLSARETKKFAVTGMPDVEVETFDGAIELHSWDQPEVEIEIEKRAMEQALLDEMKVEAQQQGNKIVLKVTGPRRQDFRGVTIGMHISPTARLRVVVPRASNVVAKSSDGSIRAEAIEGRIVLQTEDGSITATRVSGEIQARSGDGSIRLDNAVGKIDVETSDGSIGLEARPTVLLAKTGDGAIRAQIDVDTVMSDNWDLSTSDGSVTLTLPSSFNAEIDAETSDGTVRASHPQLEDERAVRFRGEGDGERRERRRILKARMGEGGKTLKVRTGDGTIRIERP